MTKPVIVTRAGKGSALTFVEGDANFTNLQNATVTVAGDSGSSQVLDLNDTLTIAGGTGLTSVMSATDTVTLNLDNTAVTPAAYTYASITVDQQGRLTAASSGTTPLVSGGALGTPSSATLTNATGLPVSSGVSGLGTSVATALAVAVGSSGAIVTNGGALGTPSSGTLTNCTFPTLNQNTTGSAATLTTPRAINGVAFDGSAAITVTAAASTLSGSTLASGVTLSSLTALGTIVTGVWTGTSISTTYTDAKIVSITGTANEISVSAGTTPTLSLPSAVTMPGSLTVTGNLTVNGTTTTVNSTTTTVDDPIFTLGGDTAPASDDNKDRGIEFRWHTGSAAKVGFFGYDDSTGYLTFIPDATNTSEVFSGTQGDIQATNFRGALIGNADTATSAATLTTGRTVAITGDLTYTSASFNGSGNVTGVGTLANTAVTPASYTYASITVDSKGRITAASSGTAPLTSGGALGTPSSGTLTNCTFPTLNQNTSGSAATLTTGRTVAITGDLTYTSGTFDGSGNVTGVGTLANTAVSAASYTYASITVDSKGRITAASSGTAPLTSGGALGTPSSGTLTNATGLPISTGVSGLGTGVATFLATPSSANLISAVTDETGTGALVFATSPTLVTPALGTPASGVLTNATGLPIGTGVSGLGTGVATFLATPTSANLISAITDESGTGALLFANSPTMVTPALGTPASGNLTNTTVDGTNAVGYRNIPAVGTKTTSYTLVVGDKGKYVQVASGGSVTIPDATFAEGDVVVIVNNHTAAITITCTITDAYIGGTDTDKATVSLATRGVCNILFVSSTRCIITGNVS